MWGDRWQNKIILRKGVTESTWELLSRDRGPHKIAEGMKAQISDASRFFVQSHSKENGKYVMICSDITCARNWTQVCHFYPASNGWNFADTWSIGQAVSEIFSFLFLFDFGVVRWGVRRGSPWTGP